jgi:hypothetical protein
MLKKLIDFVGNNVLEKGARREQNSLKISIVSKKLNVVLQLKGKKSRDWYGIQKIRNYHATLKFS